MQSTETLNWEYRIYPNHERGVYVEERYVFVEGGSRREDRWTFFLMFNSVKDAMFCIQSGCDEDLWNRTSIEVVS